MCPNAYIVTMLEFLPVRIRQAVFRLNLSEVYELRVRKNKPLAINRRGSYVFLGPNGVCPVGQALVATEKEVEELVLRACEFSLYAATEQIRQGYITAKCGERIGLAGSGVCEAGQVLTVTGVESVCVRIPHEVKGCANGLIPYCMAPQIRNTLLLAAPGQGKTTTLRDIAIILSDQFHQNVVVLDERGELSAYSTGIMSDIIRCIQKKTAIPYAIRAMRPDVLVTDELLDDEYPAVARAVQSGVKVFASAHYDAAAVLPSLPFERYVYFSGLGTIGKILDEKRELLYG